MIFWGTFFPLISEAFTGEKSSLGPPWFDQYTTPLAIVLVLFTGIGPLLAWRKVSAGVAVAAGPRAAGGRGASATVAVAAFTDALDHPLALVLFAFAFFALAALVAEFWRGAAAQRALARRRLARARSARVVGAQPPPLRRLHRPRRDRDPVHRRRRLVELPDQLRTCGCSPGESAPGRRLHGHLRAARPQSIDPKEQRLSFGVGARRRAATASRSRCCTRRATTTRRPPPRRRSRGFFEGEATSEVGRRTDGRRRPLDGDAARPGAARPGDRRRRPPARARPCPTSAPAGPTPAQVDAMRAYTDRQGAGDPQPRRRSTSPTRCRSTSASTSTRS